MKTRLNLTIDEELLPKFKEYASVEGVSISQLVEDMLREKLEPENFQSFSSKWRGKFKIVEKKEVRYETLAKRYSL